MAYVEGFVAAVPAANKEAYRKHAADAASLFKEFGATRSMGRRRARRQGHRLQGRGEGEGR